MATSITRKQFLVGAGGVAGAAALRPLHAHAARPTVIKFGTNQAVDAPLTKHVIIAAAQIKKETNGEVEVQVFPSGQLGNDTHMLADVRSGAIQMMGVGDNILSILAAGAAIDNIGFAFKDAETAYAAMDGAVGELVRSDIVNHGLQPMPTIWDLVPHQIMAGTRPIATLEDLKNFKIRVPESPISVSLFKDLGAAAVTMNFAELYTALQTHVVDGTTLDMFFLEDAKIYQVTKYCSLTNHMWVGHWMVMNGTFWKRLPADHQKAITAVFDAQALKERAANQVLNQSLQARLTSQGIKFNTPEIAPFKALLVRKGFYSYWKRKFGPELWSVLERYTGTLA